MGAFLALAAALVGFYGAFWGNFAPEDQRMTYFLVGAAGVLAATALQIVETVKLNRKNKSLAKDLQEAKDAKDEAVKAALKEGRRDFILVLDDALKPLLRKLGAVIWAKRAADRRTYAAQLQQAAVFALKAVVEPGDRMIGVRANYFKVMSPMSPNAYLKAVSSTGTMPRTKFRLLDLDSRSPNSILEMMENDSCIFTRNVEVDQPKGFDPSAGHTYKTFISTAATDGVRFDGMITIDSPDPGSLQEADQSLVRLIGTIVALSEAIKEPK